MPHRLIINLNKNNVYDIIFLRFVREVYQRNPASFILKLFFVIYRGYIIMLTTNESVENYLETILVLSKELPVVRGVDIANETGYKKSSVSVAMKNLREMNYISVSDSGYITLTESGRKIAEMIYERHQLLSRWFTSLGVSKEIATEDACKIEHVISQETFDAIKKHVNSAN